MLITKKETKTMAKEVAWLCLCGDYVSVLTGFEIKNGTTYGGDFVKDIKVTKKLWDNLNELRKDYEFLNVCFKDQTFGPQHIFSEVLGRKGQ